MRVEAARGEAARPRPTPTAGGSCMSAPARRPRVSGSCWGTRLGYRPSNGHNAPGPLPRSALAASGVRVSVGASRDGPRAGALGLGLLGAPARRSHGTGRCALSFNYLRTGPTARAHARGLEHSLTKHRTKTGARSAAHARASGARLVRCARMHDDCPCACLLRP